MAEESKIQSQVDKLKFLLGITDTEKDVLVEFAIENAEETVKNYCNIDDIPSGLLTTVLRMAADIYRNENFGDATVPQMISSMSVGDTSTSFQTPSAEFSESIMKNFKPVLNRYRKVGFR